MASGPQAGRKLKALKLGETLCNSSSALKASLSTKSGGHGEPAVGDAARGEVRRPSQTAPPGVRSPGQQRAPSPTRHNGPRPAEAARAALRGGAAGPGPGLCWGRGGCGSRGLAGVLSLPARRSPGRGGCHNPSRRAPPRSFLAPAAAEGRRAWRGPGGARGGRLHRVAPPAVPRLRPGPRACRGRCPDRGRSCRVGKVPR